ncbi:unnamed protein product [Cladocopium goreaui]|uniref:Uncharacterized protein n=1 Tax=Cladocopium goreaui TaxID=2562237 RepID=A0A9P1FNV1_9DINO|nr:unnamed protein product [Cladocopium goreaui]
MGAGWAEAPGHQKTNRDTPGRAEAPERQTHKTSHNNQKKEEHHRVSGSPGGRKDKHQPRPPKGTETPRSPRASNKNKHQPQPEKERQKATPTMSGSRRGAIGHMQTAATKRKRKQKPHSAERQAPTHPLKGRRRTPQGGQKPRSAPERQKTKTPRGAEALGHHKTNTNSSDQHQRTIANRIHHEEEKHNGLLHQGGRGDGVTVHDPVLWQYPTLADENALHVLFSYQSGKAAPGAGNREDEGSWRRPPANRENAESWRKDEDARVERAQRERLAEERRGETQKDRPV